jgi:cysteine-S-conjugate beta-lyase
MRPPSDQTKLVHSDFTAPTGFTGLSTPVHHASTVLFPTMKAFRERRTRAYDGYVYGLTGTPTTMTLAARIAHLEGGRRSVLTPSGLAAITVVYLALLKQGDHVLVPDNVYGPSRELCRRLLAGMGIETTFYDPLAGSDIATALRDNTKLVWVEAPGSITMEIPDVPAIAAAARARGARLAIDNTWSAGLYFKPFTKGCDISVQAVTKYIGGHADLMMGAITTKDETLYRRLKDMTGVLGLGVAPDDCFLALRGLPTMAARLRHHQASALTIAAWLAERSEVKRVLHPAFEDCPGHAIWERDFSGSSGLFSIVLHEKFLVADVERMVDQLRYFKIGASWGGPVSLALLLDPHDLRTATTWEEPGHLIRFNIGLEDPEDLLADLESGLARLHET